MRVLHIRLHMVYVCVSACFAFILYISIYVYVCAVIVADWLVSFIATFCIVCTAALLPVRSYQIRFLLGSAIWLWLPFVTH